MKIKILEVYEQNETLTIKVESEYGIDKFGLGLHQKYLDPETNKPKWQIEVRRLLEQKYGSLDNRSKKPLKEAKSMLNKEIDLTVLPQKGIVKKEINIIKSTEK